MKELVSEMLGVCTNPACGHIGDFPTIELFTSNIDAERKPHIDSVTISQPILLICGRCHHKTALVAPGTYAFNNKTHKPTHLIDGPEDTRNVIERVKNLLFAIEEDDTQALSKQVQINTELEKFSPALAKISREIAPSTNYKEWAALIMTLLGLLISIQQGYFKKDDSVEVRQEFIEHLLKETQEFKDKEKINVSPPAKKILIAKRLKGLQNAKARNWRHGMCSCSSGKKYLKCHGLKPRH